MNKLYLADKSRGVLNATIRPDYPDTSFGALTHKKAQVEKKNKGQEGMF